MIAQRAKAWGCAGWSWMAILLIAAIWAAMLFIGEPAHAQETDDHPLARIKKHEQELEKKIETERDRPDKKQHAKKVVNHAEENIRGLGEQIKGAGREIGSAAKSDDNEAARHHRGATSPAPKRRAQSKEKSGASSTNNGAAGTAGTVGAGGASGQLAR
jgi:hypothetical protein